MDLPVFEIGRMDYNIKINPCRNYWLFTGNLPGVYWVILGIFTGIIPTKSKEI
jgi:hypothetical protein